MRLNIIRHRQQLLKYLENVNDTVIKPKIKLNSSDLEHLNLSTTDQQPVVLPINIKKEEEEEEEPIEICDTSDELISVGSNEGWNDSSRVTSDREDVDPRRKSKRFDSINGLRKLSNNKNKDYVYYLNDARDDRVERKRSWKRPNLVDLKSDQAYTKLRDRDAHNAKERQCRNHIAEMFHNLQQNCTYLDCKRRIPSKHSILLAAKKECITLKEYENELLKEKIYWQETNTLLRRKLFRLKNL